MDRCKSDLRASLIHLWCMAPLYKYVLIDYLLTALLQCKKYFQTQNSSIFSDTTVSECLVYVHLVTEVLRSDIDNRDDLSHMWQELQRDVHKRQLLIDEDVKQSVDCLVANAATGAGLTPVWFTFCCLRVWSSDRPTHGNRVLLSWWSGVAEKCIVKILINGEMSVRRWGFVTISREISPCTSNNKLKSIIANGWQPVVVNLRKCNLSIFLTPLYRNTDC